MFNKLNLVLVFAVVFLADGVLLPGMFGFREGLLTSVFLLAMLLNWGSAAPVVWTGSAIALFLEFFWKLGPGSLVLMFLGAALIFFFISSLFTVKRSAGAAVLCLGLWLALGYNSYAIALTALAGFLFCFLMFDKLCLQTEKSTKFL